MECLTDSLEDSMQLSKNFSLLELTKSQTAERKGIDNTPNADHIYNLTALAENILQPVRDEWGSFIVSSGFRSVALCQEIGSKSTSQHAQGEAADFEVAGVDNYKLALKEAYKFGIISKKVKDRSMEYADTVEELSFE